MQNRPKVIVIGAGVSGLTAGAILSNYCTVTIFDKEDRIGGKVETRDVKKAQIDCGPTVFTLKGVFETIFKDAGSTMQDHVTARAAATLARHFWIDGSMLDLFADTKQTAEAIKNFASPRDADNYLSFCDTSEQVFDTLFSSFLQAPKPDIMKLILSKSPKKLSVIKPFETLWQALTNQFDDPRLRQLFARYATYCGSSPFECPATLMLVAHVERSGVWLLDGGMHAMIKALSTVASQNGANIVCGHQVDRIDFKLNKIIGIEADGKAIKADCVICCADIASVAAGDYGQAASRAVSSQKGLTRSQSALTWTLMAETGGIQLETHNVFFSSDYKAEFDAVFSKQVIPEEPTIYLHTRPADDNKQRPVFALINAPSNGDMQTYSDEEADAWLMRTLTQMEKHGLSLTPVPGTISVKTPTSYATRFPATGGALYGPASHGWQAAFKRHGVRTREKGFYLAGGSVHPGPGMPMAALSGRTAAMAVLEDFNLIDRSRLAAMRGGMSMR